MGGWGFTSWQSKGVPTTVSVDGTGLACQMPCAGGLLCFVANSAQARLAVVKEVCYPTGRMQACAIEAHLPYCNCFGRTMDAIMPAKRPAPQSRPCRCTEVPTVRPVAQACEYLHLWSQWLFRIQVFVHSANTGSEAHHSKSPLLHHKVSFGLSIRPPTTMKLSTGMGIRSPNCD
jgi:hypothetical protein